MKKTIQLSLLIIFLFSCKATKIDSAGNKNPTHVKKHFQKVHPFGFYTLHGYKNIQK